MCFSFPPLLDSVSGFDNMLAWMLSGAVRGCCVSSLESDRLETKDSTLAESTGTSLRLGLDLVKAIVGVVVWLCSGWGSQQRVSRFHRRHVRFSSRRPSSIDSAHFENTTARVNMAFRVSKVVRVKTYYYTIRRGVPHFSYPILAISPHLPIASASPAGSASGVPVEECEGRLRSGEECSEIFRCCGWC